MREQLASTKLQVEQASHHLTLYKELFDIRLDALDDPLESFSVIQRGKVLVPSAKLSQLQKVPLKAQTESKKKSQPKVQSYRQEFIANLN